MSGQVGARVFDLHARGETIVGTVLLRDRKMPFVLRGASPMWAMPAAAQAAIGVTRGCVRTLSRDELQGVIAHEFSHILNGDMRLDMRLMGVLFGILLIGLAGYMLLRTTSTVRVESDDRDGERRGGNPLPLIGMALYVIGYVGVFFANLIKSAVSRQREFLADASAVQFTRNPDGIAGALKKIGAWRKARRSASRGRKRRATCSSATREARGSSSACSRRTHPWPSGSAASIPPSTAISPRFASSRRAIGPSRRLPAAAQPRARTFGFNPAEAVARIGTIAAPQLLYAEGLLQDMPRTLAEYVQDPLGAQAVVFALLLDPADAVRQGQLAWLQRHVHPAVVRLMGAVVSDAQRIAPEARLPLVELSIPALRQMSRAQVHDFLAGVKTLVEADRKLTLFEYALQRLLLRHLVAYFLESKPRAPQYATSEPLVRPTEIVLSALRARGRPTAHE